VIEQIRAIGRDPAVMAMALDQARAQALEETASLESDIRSAEREIGWIHAEITKSATDAGTNAHAAARLAELHERLREAERRLIELRDQAQRAQREMVTKAEVDSALDAFTPLWEALSPREQARVLRLLIQRVDYDGANGRIAVTFHANGLRTLGQRGMAGKEEGLCQTA
jgi:site-specific DNA recombinase